MNWVACFLFVFFYSRCRASYCWKLNLDRLICNCIFFYSWCWALDCWKLDKKYVFFLFAINSDKLTLIYDLNIWYAILKEQSTFIQIRTVLKVVDNLVVKMMICIQLLKGKKVARLGDTIVVLVKEVIPNAKVKKGKIVKVVGLLLFVLPCIMVIVIEVLSNLMTMLQCYGFYLGKRKSSTKTAAWPIGKWIFGPIPHELKKKSQFGVLAFVEHSAWFSWWILISKLLVPIIVLIDTHKISQNLLLNHLVSWGK